jgi:hypothetical protein
MFYEQNGYGVKVERQAKGYHWYPFLSSHSFELDNFKNTGLLSWSQLKKERFALIR